MGRKRTKQSSRAEMPTGYVVFDKKAKHFLCRKSQKTYYNSSTHYFMSDDLNYAVTYTTEKAAKDRAAFEGADFVVRPVEEFWSEHYEAEAISYGGYNRTKKRIKLKLMKEYRPKNYEYLCPTAKDAYEAELNRIDENAEELEEELKELDQSRKLVLAELKKDGKKRAA